MNAEEHHRYYQIFKSKDIRFDGRFFIGVSSTGIYCRPVCRARLPREDNCSFYRSAAEAEQAGYRPCLLCRPELAPDTFPVSPSSELAKKKKKMIEEHCHEPEILSRSAERLGITDRHLRRVFHEEFSVSPVQYLQTCRLLLAKNLLTETGLSVTDVAMASGFGSLRRFHDVFKNRYGMTPAALRKGTGSKGKAETGCITVRLGYRTPYRFRELLQFFQSRAIPGVENVTDEEYSRTVRIRDASGRSFCGWIRINNSEMNRQLVLTISDSLTPVMPDIIGRVKHLFDLYTDPETVDAVLCDLNQIREGMYEGGVRIPGCFDSFEICVRAILGQQITVKAAGTLAGRIAKTLGAPIYTGLNGLTHLFPSAEELLALSEPLTDVLGRLGVIHRRSQAIGTLAEMLVNGTLLLDSYADPSTVMKKLKAIPGIGDWTAQYIAMRALSYPDAFMETDYGIKKALPGYTPKELRTLSERWRPWRSYAAVALWNSLKE